MRTLLSGVVTLVIGALLLTTSGGLDHLRGLFNDERPRSQTTAPVVPQIGDVSAGRLRAALAAVDVVDHREKRDDYDRESQFGTSWTDDYDGPGGHDGCDTRNQILARDLTHVRYVAGSDCEVASGILRDPYTGRRVEFDASADPNAVQIEHIYPLSLAWDMGDAEWRSDQSEAQRVVFANDVRRNLIAVDGPTNMSKGDDPPSSWLPPNHAYRCEYLYRFLRVARTYKFPVTSADAQTVRNQIPRCPRGGGHD